MAQNRASDAALLTPRELGEADCRTISAGTPGIVLMERAAAAVAIGDTFDVPVYINTGSLPLGAIDLQVVYSSTHLEIPTTSAGVAGRLC